jgi:hypothetical protein
MIVRGGIRKVIVAWLLVICLLFLGESNVRGDIHKCVRGKFCLEYASCVFNSAWAPQI